MLEVKLLRLSGVGLKINKVLEQQVNSHTSLVSRVSNLVESVQTRFPSHLPHLATPSLYLSSYISIMHPHSVKETEG